MSTHLHQQVVENAKFMLANGETFERTAARLGLTVDALEKKLQRGK